MADLSRLGSTLLRGCRVLDLTRVLAGPFATMQLADLGADVVKVERPKLGDETRHWGPPFIGKGASRQSTYFVAANRSKRSIAVDISCREGQEIVQLLAQESDVLVENFRPGKLAQYGLDYASLSASHPGLIYCSLTGYGFTGRDARRAGYDVNVAAEGGLLSITGPADGDPCKAGVAVTDLMSGMQANIGILSALYERQHTGVGRHIDANLMSTQLATLVNVASSALNADTVPVRRGTAHESIAPYQSFSVSDGSIVVSAMNDAQFATLCGVLGGQCADMPRDARFQRNADRVAHRAECAGLIQSELSGQGHGREEWLRRLHAAGLAASPVRTVPEALHSDYSRERGMVQTVTHPETGPVHVLAPPLRFSRPQRDWTVGTSDDASDDVATRRVAAPPLLGEHTEDVLRDWLRWNNDDIRVGKDAGYLEQWEREKEALS